MAEAYVDPEALRRYANELWIFVQMVEDHAMQTNNQLGRLHDSWRDQEYNYFSDRFHATQQLLRVFCEESKRTVPLLRADADKAENAQRVRMD